MSSPQRVVRGVRRQADRRSYSSSTSMTRLSFARSFIMSSASSCVMLHLLGVIYEPSHCEHSPVEVRAVRVLRSTSAELFITDRFEVSGDEIAGVAVLVNYHVSLGNGPDAVLVYAPREVFPVPVRTAQNAAVPDVLPPAVLDELSELGPRVQPGALEVQPAAEVHDVHPRASVLAPDFARGKTVFQIVREDCVFHGIRKIFTAGVADGSEAHAEFPRPHVRGCLRAAFRENAFPDEFVLIPRPPLSAAHTNSPFSPLPGSVSTLRDSSRSAMASSLSLVVTGSRN